MNTYMAIATTSIEDLPTSGQPNITLETTAKPVQANTIQPISSTTSLNNSNTIMNNVPSSLNNPNSAIQLSSTDINKIVEGIQLASANNMTGLPTRDIPMNQSKITNDPKVQPNHIPTHKAGFVEDFDKTQAVLYKQQQEHKKDEKRMNDVYDDLQEPILICVLFFIFQLPFINKTIFRYIPSLFLKERSPSLGGFLLKTILFGTAFFGIKKVINRLSSI